MKKIDVAGTIVSNDDKWLYEWCGIDAVCPNDLKKAIEDAAGDEITLVINSGGGDVMAGNEMSYMINQYAAKTTADLSGFCGSAATIVSCAVNKVRAYPSAMFMIHNVSSGASGDYHDMEQQAKILQTANEAIALLYQKKTGKTMKELLDMMDSETWFTAQKAKEAGFVDEIIGETGSDPITINNAVGSVILSDSVKKKLKNMLEKNSVKNTPDFFVAKNKLELLRMKVR